MWCIISMKRYDVLHASYTKKEPEGATSGSLCLCLTFCSYFRQATCKCSMRLHSLRQKSKMKRYTPRQVQLLSW